jgi:nicotinamide riboside kinase
MAEVTKVAFVGTSCVGKTSLLEACHSKLGDEALYVNEAAREWFTLHPDVTDRFGVSAQGEVQALALQKEKKAHELVASHLGQYSAILCDRSVLDAPVYVRSQGDNIGAQELLGRVQGWLATYGRIFLLDPADVPYAADDIRTEDEATRQLFHEAFLDFFDTNELAYELLSGSPDERFSQVQAFISGQNHIPSSSS